MKWLKDIRHESRLTCDVVAKQAGITQQYYNFIENEQKCQREQIIAFIIQTIQSLDDRKLRNIYNLVLHIK